MPIANLEQALALVEEIARMTTEEEIEGGMTNEDAIAALNDLIGCARQVTGIDPQHPKRYCALCGCDLADCDCDSDEAVLEAKTREG